MVLEHATILIDGKPISNFLSLEVGRDLTNISGTFSIALGVEFPYVETPTAFMGKKVDIFIEGRQVHSGYVEGISGHGDEESLNLNLSGRDVIGDLVDCSVNPFGPLEWKKVKLEKFISDLISPFKLSLKNQVDTGKIFETIALNPSDTILSAIEAQSRQRGVLITSDGIGGLLLTKSGANRANDQIVYPSGNVKTASMRLEQRFSDYFIKGQFQNLERPKQSAFDATLKPGQSNYEKGSKSPKEIELSASNRMGHAVDETISRYRPAVFLSKTQSGGSQALQNTDDSKAENMGSLNDQAKWRMRTAKAHACSFEYVVSGFLNGAGELWQPNQLVEVRDRFAGVFGTMLISAVTWSVSDEGNFTHLSLVPPDAFDLTGSLINPPKGQVKLQRRR